MSDWEFTKENNKGRCSFCDEKKKMDSKIITQTPGGKVEYIICGDCLTEVIADNLSKRVLDVFHDCDGDEEDG